MALDEAVTADEAQVNFSRNLASLMTWATAIHNTINHVRHAYKQGAFLIRYFYIICILGKMSEPKRNTSLQVTLQ